MDFQLAVVCVILGHVVGGTPDTKVHIESIYQGINYILDIQKKSLF